MNSSTDLPDNWKQLVTTARQARQQAYAPYSQFEVGAALQTADGRIFTGCNVENASYGLTICAERVAMSTAVAAGARDPRILCVSLPGQPSPCGSCRQFLFEFNPGLLLLLDGYSDNPPTSLRLSELLPHGFQLSRNTAHRDDQ